MSTKDNNNKGVRVEIVKDQTTKSKLTFSWLLKGVRDNGRSADDDGQVRVLLADQILGNGLAEGVRVGTAHQVNVTDGRSAVAV